MVTPIGVAQHRHQVTISGRVHSIRVQPRAEVATLECALRDDTGTINLVFLGRKHVAGIEPGTQLTVTGVVGMRQGRLEIINPDYQFRLS
jgi:RecG-like helicase